MGIIIKVQLRLPRTCFGALRESSELRAAFPSGIIPLVMLIPVKVDLEGLGPTEVFLLDVVRCRHCQLEQLVRIMSTSRNASAQEVLKKILRDRFLPIQSYHIEDAFSIWTNTGWSAAG